MEDKIYLVFEGDSWLSKESLTLMGAYNDKKRAIADILDTMATALMFNEQNTEEYTRKCLERFSQTHTGFDVRYIIKEVQLNYWEEVL